MVANKINVFEGLSRPLGLFIVLFFLYYLSNAQVVELVTEQGPVKLKLYKDTPLHNANFIKNVKEGKYNGVLFHRVIKDFMIQTGDPESVKAKPGELLGLDRGKLTVKAEILPHHHHKKGALAAARQPDQTNPKRESSQYQFYLVAGRVYTPYMLKALESNYNRPLRYKVADSILVASGNTLTKKQLDSLMSAKDFKTADLILNQMKQQTDSIIGEKNLLRFNEQQILDYTTVGGTPNLDGKYTVFGEVVDGLEVIDLIGLYETDQNNRPKTDVKILKATILEE
jgi:peptidylprolyl isomerase